MKVFISWSGERSKLVAVALKNWLPDVLQDTTPWMSEHDIDAGSRWSQKLSQVLEDSNFGIVCLTPENQKSSWVLYEAGALSKSLEESRLIPFLIGMSPSEVEPPLSQFQAVQANKLGTLKILESINSICTTPRPDERIRRIFDRWWPELESCIREATSFSHAKSSIPVRPDREILNEVLQIVRSLDNRKPEMDIAGDEKYNITIDTRLFLGDSGQLKRMRYQPDQTVSRFLDEVYYLINRHGNLPAFTYGQNWLLKNIRTGEIYDTMGIEYCRSRGLREDDTPVFQTGIENGDKLEVIPAKRPTS